MLLQKRKKKILANGTVVGGNQSPMLRHTLQMGVDHLYTFLTIYTRRLPSFKSAIVLLLLRSP